MSSVRREPTPEEMAEILSYTGRVITAQNAPNGMRISDQDREVCALLSNGWFLIDKKNVFDPRIHAVREIIKSNGGSGVVCEMKVDISTIGKVYEAANRRQGVVANHGNQQKYAVEDLTQFQKEVIGLIKKAHDVGASDIHLHIENDIARARYRANGIIRKWDEHTAVWMRQFFNTAFNMASDSDQSYDENRFQPARISRNKTPQLPEGVLAVRLMYNPAANNGSYLVMRILPDNSAVSHDSSLSSMGYCGVQLELIDKLLRLPNGMVLVSGPTGSGKSTTLQLMVGSSVDARDGEISAVTIEDPPEFPILQAVQLSIVNSKDEEDKRKKFGEAMNSVLRDDPDLIMVGEIRDHLSSSLAVTAALTGHTLLSTVHANDAPTILTRLQDNKVEAYKLSDHTLVCGLMAQRLVRKLCQNCCMPLSGNENRVKPALMSRICKAVPDKAMRENIRIVNRSGCGAKKCRGGYTGRDAVAEVIISDEEFMRLNKDGLKEKSKKYLVDNCDGMVMIEHGVQKMLAGLVDPEDIDSKFGGLDKFDPLRVDVVLELAARDGWKQSAVLNRAA